MCVTLLCRWSLRRHSSADPAVRRPGGAHRQQHARLCVQHAPTAAVQSQSVRWCGGCWVQPCHGCAPPQRLHCSLAGSLRSALLCCAAPVPAPQPGQKFDLHADDYDRLTPLHRGRRNLTCLIYVHTEPDETGQHSTAQIKISPAHISAVHDQRAPDERSAPPLAPPLVECAADSCSVPTRLPFCAVCWFRRRHRVPSA